MCTIYTDILNRNGLKHRFVHLFGDSVNSQNYSYIAKSYIKFRKEFQHLTKAKQKFTSFELNSCCCINTKRVKLKP